MIAKVLSILSPDADLNPFNVHCFEILTLSVLHLGHFNNSYSKNIGDTYVSLLYIVTIMHNAVEIYHLTSKSCFFCNNGFIQVTKLKGKYNYECDCPNCNVKYQIKKVHSR